MAGDDPEEAGARAARFDWFFQRLGLRSLEAANFAYQILAPAIQHAVCAAPDAPGRPWIPYGARSVGGRVRCLAQDPVDARVLYAGTASGGLYRTRDGGDSWQALGGIADVWPVGAVAVAPSDSRVVVVGTGESSPADPSQYVGGSGILRSLDSGDHFTVLVGPVRRAP